MNTHIEEEQLLLQDTFIPKAKQSSLKRWHWYGHGFSIVLILLLAWTPLQLRNQKRVCIRDSESFYENMESFIEDEIRIVHPQDRHEWSGPPNEVNKHLWEHMSTVGTVALTENEYKDMRLPTGEYPASGKHFVIPQVFHNLHCLKLFRYTIWNHSEITPQRHGHIDHCIENLRYNSMCTGDLSPITFWWDEANNKHQAKYDVPRQCRKWDPIWNWASDRNLLDPLGIARGKELKFATNNGMADSG